MSEKEFLYHWMGGNEVLFHGINGLHSPAYDKAMLKISAATDPKMLPMYMMAVIAWAVVTLAWRMLRKKGGKWVHATIWLGVLMVMAVGQMANDLVFTAIKDFFAYPRPFMIIPTTIILEPVAEIEYFRSFPSEHVAFAVLMLTSLWPVINKYVKYFGCIGIAVVAWSQVAVGIHFPVDTLGAVLIAVPLAMIVRDTLYKLFNKVLRIKC